jgi:hypothetical protein
MALMISSLVDLLVAAGELLLLVAPEEVVLGGVLAVHFRRSQDWEFC